MELDPGVYCLYLCSLGPVVSWLSGPGPAREATRRSPWPKSCLIPSAWLSPCALLPGSISSAGRSKQPKSRQRQLITLSTEQGFPRLVGVRELSCRAGHWPSRDRGEEGIAQIRQGLAACQAIGAELARHVFLALLAEAYGKVGQAEEGLERAGRGAGSRGQNWRAFYEAELYRLKGELTLQQRPGKVKASHRARSAHSDPQARSRSVFSQSHRDCQQAASEVAGTARDDEPRAAVATARQEARSSTRCYPRSTAGSPKGLTPKICKRRRGADRRIEPLRD